MPSLAAPASQAILMPSPIFPVLPMGMMFSPRSNPQYFLIHSLLLAKPPVATMTALHATSTSWPSSSTTTPEIRPPVFKRPVTATAGRMSAPLLFAWVTRALTIASPLPLTTWYVRGEPSMLIVASVKTTPRSRSHWMVAPDSSTIARTRWGFAFQWL